MHALCKYIPGELTASWQPKLFPLSLMGTACFKEYTPWHGFIQQIPSFQLSAKSTENYRAKAPLDVKYYYPVRYQTSLPPKCHPGACGLRIPEAPPWLESKLRCVSTAGQQLLLCKSSTSAPLPSVNKKKKMTSLPETIIFPGPWMLTMTFEACLWAWWE